MAYAALFPQRVAALILADPGGLRPISAFVRGACSAMACLGRAGTRNAWYFRPLFSLLYRVLLRTARARPQRQGIVGAAVESAHVWEQAWLSFRTREADQGEIGSHIDCPVLFEWARQDRVIPFSASRAAVRRFPNHTVAFFEGGHCPHLEDPESFVSCVTEFLRLHQVR
jgi:pimeloyl-ACP methyl ester carboxylesterase